MSAAADDGGLHQRMQRVESLVREVEELQDAVGRERARALVSALLELHAFGLGRMLDAVEGQGTEGLRDRWARDPAVSSLLLLHGLHPSPVESRLRAALAGLAPQMDALKARVTFFELDAAGARLRLEAESASSAAAVRAAVEDAFCTLAPDAALALEVEVVPPMPQGFVPLAQLVVRKA